ncbi:hypothetical protein ACPW96_22725 [Micromonospora sp. DT81.3]|uniref:hypothetical protein n=1 Tax=Micromonospora sp. DT81.3 TaxID=3416523 RepID=UPI003CEAA661
MDADEPTTPIGTDDTGVGKSQEPVNSAGRPPPTERVSAAATEGPVTERRDAAEIAKELVIDLRSELPRIDARAAAGVALAAVVLLGVMGQASVGMPIFAVAVIAAALLTVALLLFLAVLLPSPNLLSHQILLQYGSAAAVEPPNASAGAALDGSSRSTYQPAHQRKRQAQIRQLEARGREVADHLAEVDRTEYHAQVAIQIAGQLHAKQRLLLLAVASGSLGIAALAVGATWALLLGWR